MIKFAKVINEETKECQVGTGTNAEFYIKIGMTQQEVEQCEWNGRWYLAEYIPEEPQEHVKEKRISEIKAQLNALDEKSARSMRAILANTATEDDRSFLADLETQAENLRQELNELHGENK